MPADQSEEAKRRAEATYNAAADTFDAAPLSFWNRFGRRTIERIGLQRGARVLDVCCGAGASALPAAEAVGRDGAVVAIDLAEGLLRLGRAKAAAANLSWLEFRRGDMTALSFPPGHFDAVVCVFGIFFVPDMEAQVEKLWRLVRPGGTLAVTTWGSDIFAPAYDIWLSAVKRVRPELYTSFNPWDRITTPQAVGRLFADAGVPHVEVVAENGHQAVRSPEDFWTIARGSGLRWILDQLDADATQTLREDVFAALAAGRIDSVNTNVIYAVARR